MFVGDLTAPFVVGILVVFFLHEYTASHEGRVIPMNLYVLLVCSSYPFFNLFLLLLLFFLLCCHKLNNKLLTKKEQRPL